MPDENNKFSSAPSNFLDPSLDYFGTETRVYFNGSCLKQDKITYNHGKIKKNVTLFTFQFYIEINKKCNISSYPTLEIVYLGQLVWLKILILININILDMMLDLIENIFFQQAMELIEM